MIYPELKTESQIGQTRRYNQNQAKECKEKR